MKTAESAFSDLYENFQKRDTKEDKKGSDNIV